MNILHRLLIVPLIVVLSLVVATPASAEAGVAAPVARPAAEGDTTYVVRNGDSLYRIAAKFNVTVEALMAANNLTTLTLHPGQTLIIPGAVQDAVEPDSIYDRVSGSTAFVRRIKVALDWLQAHDPDAYARVNTYITVISPSPYARLADASPMPGGGCSVRALARRSQSVEMIAALLYHEASHCYQFATDGLLTSKEAEVFAYSEQIAFMERNNFPAEIIEYYRQVLDYYASQPDDGQYIPPPNI
ncbi:MAG TPA: LysM peptidoglycan-binding domain-containing protein [Anaerolineales bacterium]|nr:LysM peptidoglycan-binding domain-containing protein [Anaerolineales bacterium]